MSHPIRRNRERRGFTLVEMLMVIAILGVLSALLLTAVQGAREMSRRSVCENQIGELAKAILAFETKNQQFPGWQHHPFEATDAATAQRFSYSTSWFPQLLEELGHGYLMDRTIPLTWRRPLRNGTATFSYAPTLHKLAVCPSDFDKMLRIEPLLSYAVNCGRKDVDPTTMLPCDWRANGVFHNLWNWRVNPNNRVATWGKGGSNDKLGFMNTSYISKYDGLSTTLLIAENADATLYYDRNETTNGFVFDPPSSVGAGFKVINGPGFGGAYATSRPSGRHPGGVMMAFADGHTKFVRESLSYSVYVQLMTPDGAHAQEPGTLNPSEAAIRNAPAVKADDL